MWGDIRGRCLQGREPSRLYRNRGRGAAPEFVDVASSVGLDAPGNARGMAAVDLDDDGRLDLVVTRMYRAATIYRNVARVTGGVHWIGFALEGDGRTCNRAAAGSRVRIRYGRDGAESQLREVRIVNGFAAQADPRVHFGLGDAAGPVTVEVDWCGRGRRSYTALQPDRYHRLAMNGD
jgi:hypothetical protein